MRIINLYQETLGIVSDCCKVSKEKIISSKKEECVNARYILVSILGEWYTDNEIAELTGLSRPCPTPAFITCNPWGCNGGFYGNGYPFGYNDGCGCNG